MKNLAPTSIPFSSYNHLLIFLCISHEFFKVIKNKCKCIFLFLPLTQKITSSAHCLHLLPYLLAVPECAWVSPCVGFSCLLRQVSCFFSLPPSWRSPSWPQALSKGSLTFAELHSDAGVRPKLASEEFSGCGQLFHSTSTYFRTYSEQGAVLASGSSVITKAHIGQIVTELQLW